MRQVITQAGFLAGIALLTVGCGHRSQTETPAPEIKELSSTSLTSTPISARGIPESLLDNARRATLEDRIYFGFDQSDINSAARQGLLAKVEVLRDVPSLTLRIEGHADERGSDEYNLALSNRRAAVAKRFLVNQGISADRLETVGYGEEQALESDETEAAWARNRRDEFRVSSGPLAQQ
jgi:peptidoglycan-associated lipoprotein